MANGITAQSQSQVKEVGGVLSGLRQLIFPVVELPNALTVETFEKTDAGKELHRVSSIGELMEELES